MHIYIYSVCVCVWCGCVCVCVCVVYVCVCVTSKYQKCRGLGPSWFAAPQKKNLSPVSLFFSTFLFKIVAKYTNSCNNLWALFKFVTVHVHFSLDWGTETDTLADANLCKLHFVERIQITESADMMLPTCKLLLRPVTSELKPIYQCTIPPCIIRIQTSSNYCRNYVALVHLPIMSTAKANYTVICIRKGNLASQMRQPSKQDRSLWRPTQLPFT